jgi:hypothetical protein
MNDYVRTIHELGECRWAAEVARDDLGHDITPEWMRRVAAGQHSQSVTARRQSDAEMSAKKAGPAR